MNQPDVSIVIVNWNTKKLLCDCITSIYRRGGDVNCEIIIVDNGSRDNSVQVIRSRFPAVELIANQVNRGYAAACNQGISISRGRYVLILNSDTVVCNSAVEKTICYADGHPEVAVVGCQIRQNPSSVQLTCFRFPSIANLLLWTFGLAKIFKNNRILGREWMRWWQRDSEREVDVVSGMFMLVRKAAIEKVSLMDEDYFFYGEEVDWCYRFSKAEWKIVFWPGAWIIHVHGGGQSSKKIPVRAFVQQQKSTLIFFRKHRGFITYIFARLIMVVLFCLRYCLWTMVLALKFKSAKKETYKLERQKTWWALKFCALGIEPGKCNSALAGAVSQKVTDAVKFVLAMMHFVFLTFLHQRTRRVVLYYHNLKKEDIPQFEKQMAYLAKNCSVVKPSIIKTACADGSRILAAITFDDAFRYVIENAAPIVKKYNLSMGISVPTGYLGSSPQWFMNDDCSEKNELVMNEQDVRELDRLGFEVLSHTISHPVLTQIDDESLQSELIGSRQMLEKIVGHRISGICYPYGTHNEKVRKTAELAGYQFGFTVEPVLAESSAGNLQIGRFAVSPAESMIKFKLKVNGAYQAAKYLSEVKKLFVRAKPWELNVWRAK